MTDLPRYHVAAGSYYVGKTEPKILQAFLGTCVGVAIFDSEAGIGGLIHLLLPEPILPENSFMPEKYASKGLPLFIKALYDAGAARENLKAFIVGGALVGPLTETDLALDIGGRTADVANKLLAEEGIQTEKPETGGFFTCDLNLNMQNWEISIEPAGYYKLSSGGDIDIPDSRDISRVIDRIQPIPQVALKILRIIDKDDYNFSEIAMEVRKDQVLGAKTLRLCNSAMFAPKNRIASIDHALVYLGQNLLVKLVISATVDDFFNRDNRGYSLCKGGLYHHAIGTATIAEKLAKFTGKALPNVSYTAGLLHDIGKVVLDQYIASGYTLFYRKLHEEKENSIDAEKKILGTDHTQVGSKLAQKWSFPESLIDMIKNHHNPENTVQDPELTYIVYLADLLMSRFHAGLELERIDTATLALRLEEIGLSISRFPEIVDLIPNLVFGGLPELTLKQYNTY